MMNTRTSSFKCRSTGTSTTTLLAVFFLGLTCVNLVVAGVFSYVCYRSHQLSLETVTLVATLLVSSIVINVGVVFFFVSTRRAILVKAAYNRCLHEASRLSEYNQEPKGAYRPPRSRRVLMLEGTACIGKTTNSHKTFDFSRYIKEYPGYAAKNNEMFVQSLYEANLYADILYALFDENEDARFARTNAANCCRCSPPNAHSEKTTPLLRKLGDAYCGCGRQSRRLYDLVASDPQVDSCPTKLNTLFDRSPFSQVAYAIFFKFDGPTAEPHEFEERVASLLDDEQLVAELTRVFSKWTTLLHLLFPELETRVLWFGAQSPSATVDALNLRGTPEVEQRGWNLLYFIHNQNTVFRRLQQCTRFGSYNETKFLNRAELESIRFPEIGR